MGHIKGKNGHFLKSILSDLQTKAVKPSRAPRLLSKYPYELTFTCWKSTIEALEKGVKCEKKQ